MPSVNRSACMATADMILILKATRPRTTTRPRTLIQIRATLRTVSPGKNMEDTPTCGLDLTMGKHANAVDNHAFT